MTQHVDRNLESRSPRTPIHDPPGDGEAVAEAPAAPTRTRSELAPPKKIDAPRVETFREMIRSTYLSIDRRTLGLTRILLGTLLVGDLFRRTPDWIHMFGDTGVLPTVTILQRPQAGNFSLLHGFSANWELGALWAVMLFTFLCVLVGYKTKVAQVVSLLFIVSLNGRVLLIENGGYVVNNLLLLWTCFMPMGDRFSLDAMIAEMRRKRETTAAELNDRTDVTEPFRMRPFVSLVGFVILMQASAIYYFNVVHKYGPAWDLRNATAVHFVMYVDRMANPLVADIRTHIPFEVYRFMGRMVIIMEAALPYMLLLPMLPRVDWLFTKPGKKSFFPDFSTQKWARRTAAVLMCFLHIGFGSSFTLGPFAWSLCVFSTLLFTHYDWEDAIRTMRRPSRSRTVLFDTSSGAALFFCRVVKRMDRFDLVGFDDANASEARHGIVVERRDGSQAHGAQALSEIVAALPVGPVFAWMIRLPLVSSLVDAAMQRGRWSRLFGLTTEAPTLDVDTDVAGATAMLGLSLVLAVGVLLTLGLNVIKLSPDLHPFWRVLIVLGTLWTMRWLWKKVPLKAKLVGMRGTARELVIGAMFAAALNQAFTELWSTKKRWADMIADINKIEVLKSHGIVLSPQPEAMQLLAHKARFLQGWFMFSPNPVMDDGTIIADAITVDGRHVDPFWNKPPNFDLHDAHSYGYNQIWSDYFNRIQLPGNRAYRDACVDYMRRLPERTGNPNDAIVSGSVYWVHDWNPKWGTHESYGQVNNLLFTFDKEGGAKEPPPPAPAPKKEGTT